MAETVEQTSNVGFRKSTGWDTPELDRLNNEVAVQHAAEYAPIIDRVMKGIAPTATQDDRLAAADAFKKTADTARIGDAIQAAINFNPRDLYIALTGGSDKEDITSIKFNAPRMYAAQNRAVTSDDYKALIYNKFAQAQSVQVWGGEDGIATGITVGYSNIDEAKTKTPQYGKVFICMPLTHWHTHTATMVRKYMLRTLTAGIMLT